MKTILISALSLSILAAAATSNAVVYRWTWDGVTYDGLNHDGGHINAVSASYDTDTQEYTFDATIGKKPGTHTRPSGFWMASSNGPNPKGTADELPLFYFDASRSTSVVTAYSYNGENGSSSWYDGDATMAGNQTPDRISSSKVAGSAFSDISVTDSGSNRNFHFKVAGSVINAHTPMYGDPSEWDGVEFAERFGIWLHPVTSLSTSYNSQGYLTGWNHGSAGWLDAHDMPAVPEPASMTALAIGAAAMLRRRRK